MIHFVRRNKRIRQEKRVAEEEFIFSVPRRSSWTGISGLQLFTSLQKEFRDHIKSTCFGKYESRHLEVLRSWLWIDILPIVDEICLQNPIISNLVTGRRRNLFEDDMEKLLLQAFGETMATDMFRMCIEYPDSQPILLDLRYCLKQTGIREVIVENLKGDLEKRLLHTGVTTVDVVDAYVSVVRCLKFLDPEGILLQLVTSPVRDYLKQREETIRVILVSLTEESGDLAEELAKNPTDLADKSDLDTKWQTWLPDPIDIPRDKYNLREADLIHTFVSIYGSKTMFIDEYRALLADRLLKMPKPTSVPRELKCLELLKLRFGDSDLQKCEVMLKDVADSQRMNTRFYEDHGRFYKLSLDFTGLIVSAQFWPTFKSDKLELPPPVCEAFALYTKTFEGIKGNRSLEWHNHIGTVEIEMDHLGKTTTYNCSPTHATILWHFQQKSRWTLDELSEVTKASVATLRSRIRFWVTRGVLVHSKTDTYSLQEEDEGGKGSKRLGAGSSATKYMEEEEMDSPMTSTNALRETELQMFWSYIEGMLTNLGTLPLTRIHSMLKLFATVECSSEELQKFLDEKVSQGILVYSAGQYQLQK